MTRGTEQCGVPDRAAEGTSAFERGKALATGLLDTPRILRAREAFATAARLCPEWPAAWLELARTSAWLADVEAMAAALERCIALEPTNAEAWFLRYTLLAEGEDHEDTMRALERAAALSPPASAIAYELERVRATASQPRRTLARFPLEVAAFADLEEAIERHLLPELGNAPPFLRAGSRVFTTGSCFARNIAIALRELGVSSHHTEQLEDVASTYANRVFLEWLLGAPGAHDEVFARVFGETYRAQTAQALREADVVVYSLGVAAGFFERETGRPVLALGMNQNLALQARTMTFRTTSVPENVENLLRIGELIDRATSRAVLVVTVSPVPLRATLEHGSAIVADCVSKSTLRVAADEFMRRRGERTLYWPSFEAVRWIGGYTGPAFGAEDGNAFHVNHDVVRTVLRAFVRRFGDQDLRTRLAQS